MSAASVRLRDAANAIREDATDDQTSFLYAVSCVLDNVAQRIDRAPATVSAATPERIYADVIAVADLYLRDRGWRCPLCRGEGEATTTYCTCGHYHDKDRVCVPECGCQP